MEKEVNIKIVGEVSGEEEITTCLQGNYYKKDKVHYIQFVEQVEDEVIRNLYKFSDTVVHVNKKGTTNTSMEFTVGENTSANYITPYGIFLVQIYTKKIKLLVEEGLIRLQIEYTMKLQEGEEQKHSIVIAVTPLNTI